MTVFDFEEIFLAGLEHLLAIHTARESCTYFLLERTGASNSVCIFELKLHNLLLLMIGERIACILINGLMNFDEFTAGEHDKASTLATMEHGVAILMLQSKAYSFGDHVGDGGQYEDSNAREPHDLIDRESKVSSKKIVTTVDQRDHGEGKRHGPHRSTGRGVAGTFEEMVLSLIAGHPCLDKGPERKSSEHDSRGYESRNQNVPGNGMSEGVCLPVRSHTYQAIEPTHVPVGL